MHYRALYAHCKKNSGSVTAPTLLPAKGIAFFVLPARGVVISLLLTLLYYHILPGFVKCISKGVIFDPFSIYLGSFSIMLIYLSSSEHSYSLII